MSGPRNRPSGQVRIIGGKWRGRKLPVLSQDGLRPTTDRTKETLFNWLMHDIRDSVCLDAFAGTGSLGFEALSRGAQAVTFVEKDKRVASNIRQNCEVLKQTVEVINSEAIQALGSFTQPFDGIFADPPFGQNLLVPFIEAILTSNALRSDGWLYTEYESQLALPAWPQLHLHREKRTAQFVYALYYLTAD